VSGALCLIGFGAFALNAWALNCIRRKLDALTQSMEAIRMTIDEVNAKADAAQAKVDELVGQAQEIAQIVRDLRAAGTGATPEQLDALGVKLDAITGSGQAGVDTTKDVDPTP
jgi:methyl-accepting chemotaxis protein